MRAHLASLIEDRSFAKRACQDVVEGVAPVVYVVGGVYEDVGSNVEAGNRMVESYHLGVAWSLRAEGFGFHDDQVNVRIVPCVAAGAGAEENHLLGIDFIDDGSDHAVEEIVSDAGHCSTSLSSFSSPSVISRSIARTSRINSGGSSSGTGSAT